MALAAVSYKAIVILLLIHCLLLLPMFVKVLCWFLFCYVVLSVMSCFAIVSVRKTELVADI